ncbi:MAG: hypothetical protein K2W95_11605 [Candidatus Obscuribacterales bacterium]|nr:hypothetical protein [Candidatus Obscuribacterales bacterium]
MFLRFFGLGRKTENAQEEKQRKAGAPETTERNFSSEDSMVRMTSPSGRDSLSQLRSVARGGQTPGQGRGRWFGRPEDSSRGIVPVKKQEVQEDSSCPVIPESDRRKAIEALLGIGIDHFTVKSDD